MGLISRELLAMCGMDPDDPNAIKKRAAELDRLDRAPVKVLDPCGDSPATVH